MALVTQKFTATITDETDPTTTQEINFTDDSHVNYAVNAVTIAPYDHLTHPTWKRSAETILLNVSPVYASYVIVKTDNPIYVWIGRSAERDGSGDVDEGVTPKTAISSCLILSGGTGEIYAINPSADNDVPAKTAHIKVTYVY